VSPIKGSLVSYSLSFVSVPGTYSQHPARMLLAVPRGIASHERGFPLNYSFVSFFTSVFVSPYTFRSFKAPHKEPLLVVHASCQVSSKGEHAAMKLGIVDLGKPKLAIRSSTHFCLCQRAWVCLFDPHD
jgi:hypothetical protein